MATPTLANLKLVNGNTLGLVVGDSLAIVDFTDWVIDVPAASGSGSVTEGMLRPLPPARPEDIVVTRASDFLSVDLSWPAIAGATHYEIYRASAYREVPTLIDTVTAPIVTYQDSPINADTSYRYTVRALNATMNVDGLRSLPSYTPRRNEALTS